RVIKHQVALQNLRQIEPSYKSFPTDAKWVRGKLICEFLKPFDEITKMFSGSTYPTSNLYFKQIWNIECWLRRHEFSSDEVIEKMVENMKLKFDKYWEEYSEILAIGAVLDPRMKFVLLEFCFNALDPSTSAQKCEHIRKKMYTLFGSYQSNMPTTSTGPSQTFTSTSNDKA
ncbi:hypothetical protein CARUB_v100165484mg, partial [Capsella rubella]